MDEQNGISSNRAEQNPEQTSAAKKQVQSGRKKAGLALVIICPIIFILFLVAYAAVTYIFALQPEISLTTQKIVKIIFQTLPVLAIIGFPVGLYLMFKNKSVEKKPENDDTVTQ